MPRATLAETVKSALAQPVECEVIIVNDGSTDGSQQIIDAFGARVRSLTTVNCGVSAARSSGLALAKGDFINYLDSDDVLTPGTLRARLDAIAREGADVVHTDWRKLVQRGDGRFALGDIERPDVGAIAVDAERETALARFWAPPAALLYTRAIVVRIGAWHPKLPIIQDARYLFDAAAQGARFAYVAGVGAYYRVRSGSLSHNRARYLADCHINAAEIEELWRVRGSLGESRRAALAEMWSHVASASLREGLPGFEAAREGYNRHAAKRLEYEVGRLARLVAGPSRAARFYRAVRRGRAGALYGRWDQNR